MRPQDDAEELLCPCWCGADFAEIPAEMVRRRETWECGPKCLATYERRGVKYRPTNTYETRKQ